MASSSAGTNGHRNLRRDREAQTASGMHFLRMAPRRRAQTPRPVACWHAWSHNTSGYAPESRVWWSTTDCHYAPAAHNRVKVVQRCRAATEDKWPGVANIHQVTTVCASLYVTVMYAGLQILSEASSDLLNGPGRELATFRALPFHSCCCSGMMSGTASSAGLVTLWSMLLVCDGGGSLGATIHHSSASSVVD